MLYFKFINDGIRFLLELIIIGIFASSGFCFPLLSKGGKIFISLCSVLMIILFWSYFGAPKSPYRLTEPFLLISKILIFTIATVMLAFTTNRTVACIFACILLINTVLTYQLDV